jgi:hypothetical protein
LNDLFNQKQKKRQTQQSKQKQSIHETKMSECERECVLCTSCPTFSTKPQNLALDSGEGNFLFPTTIKLQQNMLIEIQTFPCKYEEKETFRDTV